MRSNVLTCHRATVQPLSSDLITLFHQGTLRTGLEPVPNLDPIFQVLLFKEPSLGQEKWFVSGTNILLIINLLVTL